MTPAGNYREAVLLLQDSCEYGCPHAGCGHEMARLARAQVHALMVIAAAAARAAGLDLHADDEHGEG